MQLSRGLGLTLEHEAVVETANEDIIDCLDIRLYSDPESESKNYFAEVKFSKSFRDDFNNRTKAGSAPPDDPLIFYCNGIRAHYVWQHFRIETCFEMEACTRL